MRMRKLPNSELVVSELCLGTMMYGDQVTKEDAFLQLDAAIKEYGINFVVYVILLCNFESQYAFTELIFI